MSEPGRARRADARQNRARILEVAREALAVDTTASLNSIAKRAGVGPGTLYRHFPDRESLLLAVYRTEVERLVDRAPRLLCDEPPLTALRRWSERLAGYITLKRGLGDALSAAQHDTTSGSDMHRRFVDAVTLFLQAGEEDGTIRAGLDPDDVLTLLGCVWRLPPGPTATSRAARLLDLIVESLRQR